ncbi:DNA-binding transcriptional LysR family regulator [Janibacter alkaliphilus]|uniref:DNA-binding transcriptional LysR family regulator n=1 Tax=Janibacter alkaliphilus TaxID=1069963 RepID=A0A852X4F0_9MICO|nr:DNA-binding transcriptional LysR family regulator [Janibacter alkaliphilus]
MELHHVRAFLAVAEELHFGRAAQRLHMAQPPLSRTIKQLERHLGCPLFERTTRTVRLTPQGEALIGPAQEIIRAVEHAERAVAHAEAGEIGRVRVGFAGPSSHELISELARTVRRTSPGIELELSSVTYGTEVVGQLLAGDLDVAMVRLATTPPGLASRIIREERYVVAMPDSHPLAEEPEVHLADLADEGWVTLSASSGSLVREALLEMAQDAGFVPRIAQQAPDSWTIMALVAAGVGVSLTIDTAFAAVDPSKVRVVPLAGEQTHTYASLAWREEDRSPALARVIALSEQVLPTPPDAPVRAAPRAEAGSRARRGRGTPSRGG